MYGRSVRNVARAALRTVARESIVASVPRTCEARTLPARPTATMYVGLWVELGVGAWLMPLA